MMRPQTLRWSVLLLLLANRGVAFANDWPQLGFDAARTRATNEVSGTPFRLAWKAPVSSSPIVASPAIADGTVVVAAADGRVRALREGDGSALWAVDAGAGFGASPAIQRGRVYIPTLGGHLLAIRLGDGSLAWNRALGGQNYGSPALSGSSLILATGFPTQKLVRVDAATGDVQWETAPGVVAGLANSSPAIDGGQLVVGMNNGRYQAIDVATGAAGWAVDTRGLVNLSSPLLVGTMAYFVPGGGSAEVYAVDRSSGKAPAGWPVTLADPDAPPPAAVISMRHAVSSPTSAGSMLVVQIRFEYEVRASDATGGATQMLNEYVVAIDPTIAAVAWQQPVATRRAGNVNEIPELGLCPTPAAFVTAGGSALAVASSLSATLRVLDGASGAMLWSASLSAPTRSSPALANGQIFVGTDAGFLHAFISDANQAPSAPVAGFVPGNGAAPEVAVTALGWSPAADPDGTPPSYQVRVDSDGEILESWLAELTTAPGENRVTLPRGLLRSGGSYVYAVRSRDSSGALSPWSARQSFTTALTPAIEVAGSSYDTLEDAVAAAQPGATVHVGRGLLHLGATLRLRAGTTLAGLGAHETELEGAGLAAAVEIGAGGEPAALEGMTVSGAWVGVKVIETRGNVLRNVVVRDNVHAGIEVAAGAGAEVVNASLVRNGIGASSAGTLSVRNSIVTDNETGLSRAGDGGLTSRYNDLYANIAANYERVEAGLGDLSVAVVFAGESRRDYRLALSQATTDRGDPADDFSQEPAPNGGRVNMGAFGASGQAERSATGIASHEPAQAPAGESGCSLGGSRRPGGSGAFLILIGAALLAVRRSRRAVAVSRRRGGRSRIAFAVTALALLVSGRAYAVTRQQAVKGRNNGGTSVQAKWSSKTDTGNLLVAVIAVRGGSGTVITPPAGDGWVLATRSNNGTTISTAIYYSPNAAQQSSWSTWSLSADVHATLSLIEYAGAAPSAVLDQTGTATGSGTAAASGTTAATAQDSEVAVAAFSVADVDTFSSETNGFAEVTRDVSSRNDAPTDRNTTAVAEKLLSATGTQSTAATSSGDGGAWAAAIATFKTAVRYWVGTGSDCLNASSWSLSSGGASNTGVPGEGSVAVFDGGRTTSCNVSDAWKIESLQTRSGYTGTVTTSSGSASVQLSGDLKIAAGTVLGEVAIDGALTMTGGTLDLNGESMTFSNAPQINGGTFKVGSGTLTMSSGITVGSGGTLDLTIASGKLQLASATTLAMNGTLSASGSGSSIPRIDSSAGNYAFTVGSTALLNVTGLRIDHTDANGMKITNATFRAFQNLQFRSNAGGTGSTHLFITSNALDLYAPGCYFDGTAAIGVKLVGNGDADGQTRADFEYRSATINGARAGQAYDSDDDVSPRDGVGDNPGSNGAVVQWLYSVMADTAGTVEGFPTAAFDWSTFTWYGVYVAYRDTTGAGTTDRIYVRNMDGDAQYSYSIAQTDGDIIGTPRWDSLNEVTLGADINGDGDQTDTAVHVLYVPTTSGKIYKLIDSGASLAPPGASSVWATAFTDARITSITSPLVSDGTNLYFGGKDNGTPSAPRAFGVQIAKGVGEKTLVKNIGAASVITVAPAWKIYSGSTYLFIGSQALSGQAYIYRMDVAPGASINAQCLDAKHDVNGSIRLIGDHAVVGDSGGRVHQLAAGTFTVGGFANTAGFPFRDTTTHTAAFLDAGSGAVTASPYIDTTTGRIYFGDKDGHLYAVTSAGALLPGYPLRLSTTDQLNSSPIYSSGVIMIGSSGGKVYYVDQQNDSAVPAAFDTLSFGSIGISSISYNASKSQYMAATTGGQLFFINKLTDPTPSSL